MRLSKSLCNDELVERRFVATSSLHVDGLPAGGNRRLQVRKARDGATRRRQVGLSRLSRRSAEFAAGCSGDQGSPVCSSM